jgi:DnaJ-class molecular chaperone
MAKFRTHYDNLKVSRDAPAEVIQAAYRTLARKYHPDRAGNTPDGEAIMKVINASYEVLSDPVKRAKHDAWIDERLRGGATGRDQIPSADSSSERRMRRKRSWSSSDIMLAVAYFGTALVMLRVPHLRVVAIVMLVAGWMFLQARAR